LSNCRLTWLKIARVVAFAHRDLGSSDDEATYETLAAELTTLVGAVRLEAIGDLLDWRNSEVRLTQSASLSS